MIHNAFLIHLATNKILASEQYWPIEVTLEDTKEFISTRRELMSEHSGLEELPLIIGDHKFVGRVPHEDLLVILVTDKAEDEQQIATRVENAAAAIGKKMQKMGLEPVVTAFASIIEPSIITRLKIALVGEGGTGKTTTLHLLLGDTPPLQYVPTIALNLETVENIRFGNYSLVLWDFAGQERFRKLWKFYFHGADVIILVCDSTLRNVIITKDILKLIRRDAPKVPIFALANKQDKSNAMRPEVVQKILGVPTFPMVAIDKSRRDEMLRILMNAAAQYIGVALPDLPVSELLRFTEIREDAEVEEEVEEEADEDEEEYVYVDEEGRVIEDIEDYEIIKEEATEEIESIEVTSEELVAPEPEEVPFDVEIEEGAPDTAEEIEAEVDELPDEPEAVEVEDTAGIEEPVIEVVSPSTDEEAIAFDVTTSSPGEVDVVVPIVVESEPLQEEPEVLETPEEVDGAVRIAIDLISDALDADDFVAAEIESASDAELEHALEAFSCDETVPCEGEEISPSEVGEEVLSELDSILGALDSLSTTVGDPVEDETAPDDQGPLTIEDLIPALDYDAVEEATEEETVSIVIEEFSDDIPFDDEPIEESESDGIKESKEDSPDSEEPNTPTDEEEPAVSEEITTEQDEEHTENQEEDEIEETDSDSPDELPS